MTTIHIIGLVADIIVIGTAIGVGIFKVRQWSKRFSEAMRQGMRG